MATLALLAAGFGLLGPAAPALAGPSSPPIAYVNEPFTGSNVQIPNDWTTPPLATGITGTNVACLTATAASPAPSLQPVPNCAGASDTPGTGSLQLTSVGTSETATGGLDGGVAYTTALPASEGLDVSFDSYQYGGTGADGISFFLAAANPKAPAGPPNLGPPGGHLGYSSSLSATTGGGPYGTGLADGYLGIGLDAYGNYTNTSYDGNGCNTPSWITSTGAHANEVTVRGPGSGYTGYCLLASTLENGGLVGSLNSPNATRAGTEVPVEVAINPTPTAFTTPSHITVPPLSYVASVTPIKGPTQLLTGTLPNATGILPSNLLDANGIPQQLSFGWSGSTGGSTDVHEITNVVISPVITEPPRFGLSLTDSDGGYLVAGGTVSYTATPTLSSSGASESTAPSFTDSFPTGLTPTAASGGADWSCTVVAPTVSCNYIGALPITAGTTLGSISISATVSASSSGAVDDTGEIVEAGAVVASATDPATATSAAATHPVLGLSLSDNAAGAFTQGSSVTYQATGLVSATGANEADAPSFTDTFPTGVTPTSATGGSDWGCTVVAPTVSCNYIGARPIVAGSTLASISMTATVGASASGGIADTATLSSADATAVSSTDYATVESVPTYTLGLSDSSSGNLGSGSSVTYTAAAALGAGGNESDAPQFTDTFPTGVTPTSAAGGADWGCTVVAPTVTCAYAGTLPIAAGTPLASITIAATVGTNTTGTNLDDSATVGSNDATSVSATDYAAANEPPAPVLGLTSSAPSDATSPGTFAYILQPSVTSSGGQASSDPVVTVSLPSGESFSAAATPTDWSCVLSNASTSESCTYSGTTPIAPGAPIATIPLTVDVAAGTSGDQTINATMSDVSDHANSTSTSATVNVVPRPTISAISPSQGPGAGGTVVTVTGTNLTGATIDFGTSSATSVSCTATTCTATSPAGAGTVDVTATTADGTSATSAADQFTYASPQGPVLPPAGGPLSPPAVTALTPAFGPSPGGTVVTITGSNLTGGTVSFGSAPATNVSCAATSCTATSPAGSGTVTVTVTTSGGEVTAGSFTYTAGSAYTAVTPFRVTDTRPGSGEPSAGRALLPGGTLSVKVAGIGAVPSDASAVVLNLTASDPSSAGFLTVFPEGGSLPAVSNLDFTPHETVPNLVTVLVGNNGEVSVYNSAGVTNVVVDVEGYYSPVTVSGAGLYDAVSPSRVLGSLAAGHLVGASSATAVTVTGPTASDEVPASATAVVVNLTVQRGSSASFLTAYPAGASLPLASDVNFTAGETTSNRAIVAVGKGGQIMIYNHAGNVEVDVDVDGYYTAAGGSGSAFVAIDPVRLVDTRARLGGSALAPKSSESLPLTNASIPADATAVATNVTVVAGGAPGYLTVYPPALSSVPVASDLNWTAGETVANFTTADTASTGKTEVYNSHGDPVNVVVDAFGYFVTAS
ncbi:MAG: IPT/TIG domain-containing protein [Acidimicrobiales bacterium]